MQRVTIGTAQMRKPPYARPLLAPSANQRIVPPASIGTAYGPVLPVYCVALTKRKSRPGSTSKTKEVT